MTNKRKMTLAKAKKVLTLLGELREVNDRREQLQVDISKLAEECAPLSLKDEATRIVIAHALQTPAGRRRVPATQESAVNQEVQV